jgi:hypothetical protein
VEEPFGVFLKPSIESGKDDVESEKEKETTNNFPAPFSILRTLFGGFFSFFLAQFSFPVSNC